MEILISLKRVLEGLDSNYLSTVRNVIDDIFLLVLFIGKAYEINRRIVFTMRLLGVGYEGIRKFCGFMTC